MPPKNLTDLPELYVQQPDGTKIKIGKIQEAQIIEESDYDIYDDHAATFPSKTATFEVLWNPTVDTVYLLIHGRLPSNNWRRMRGYAVRRRAKRKQP